MPTTASQDPSRWGLDSTITRWPPNVADGRCAAAPSSTIATPPGTAAASGSADDEARASQGAATPAARDARARRRCTMGAIVAARCAPLPSPPEHRGRLFAEVSKLTRSRQRQGNPMGIRAGIVGISGYGGGEAMRLIAAHPSFELVYAAGEGSAGSALLERFPGAPAKLADLVIQKWDPSALPKLDVLFASLPTGASFEALKRVPKDVKIVDIGGDQRYADGWVYGLADVWPDCIRGASRVANPGCFPAAALIALAPLLAAALVEPGNVVIDAKTGISGAGRGGGENRFGYAEVNEDLSAYGLLQHVHMPEIARTIEALSEGGS